MKITITQHRELIPGRIVKPGDVLESPKDGSEEALQAYVNNQIATMAIEPRPTKKTEVADNEL